MTLSLIPLLASQLILNRTQTPHRVYSALPVVVKGCHSDLTSIMLWAC